MLSLRNRSSDSDPFAMFGLAFPGFMDVGSDDWHLPRVDVVKKNDGLEVRADLPGMKREDLEVDVDNGVLTISGSRGSEKETVEGEVLRSERQYGKFVRRFSLPEGIDSTGASASYADGILVVRVPTNPAPKQSRKIQIQ